MRMSHRIFVGFLSLLIVTSAFAQGGLAVAGFKRGQYSPPSENEDNTPDTPPPMSLTKVAAVVSAAGAKHVGDLQNAQQFFQALGHEVANWQINTALIGGNKYMINDCLGIKASAGEFNFRPGAPSLRIDGTGVLLQFVVDRITMNALMVRVRPNVTNPTKLCHFSKRFGVGGSASNVRFELRFDPLLNLKRCRVLTAGNIRPSFAIGGFNLKPLQNNLDPVAKNMVEDAINSFLTGGTFSQQLMNATVRAFNTTCNSAGT
jgi:hypothetical protein